MKPGFCTLVRADFAVLSGARKILFVCLLTRAGFQAVFLYRLASYCLDKGGWFGRGLARFFSRLNIFLNGCDIDPRAAIGPGLKLSHPVGIVIGIATIGSRAMLLQNTTLGLRRFTDHESDRRNYPTLGDDVVICAGAMVAGGVLVGDGAIVGANAVVLQDIPPRATAVGAPARIILPAPMA